MRTHVRDIPASERRQALKECHALCDLTETPDLTGLSEEEIRALARQAAARVVEQWKAFRRLRGEIENPNQE